jgi:hypothetical protein
MIFFSPLCLQSSLIIRECNFHLSKKQQAARENKALIIEIVCQLDDLD